MRHHLTSLFSYENEEAPAKAIEPQPTQPTQPTPQNLPSVPQQDTPAQSIEHVPTADSNSNSNPTFKQEQNDDDESRVYGENIYGDSNGAQGMQNQGYDANQQQYDQKPIMNEHGFSGTVGIKEDG